MTIAPTSVTKQQEALSFSIKVHGPSTSANDRPDEYELLLARAIDPNASVGENIAHLSDPEAWCNFFLDIVAKECDQSKPDVNLVGSLIYYSPLKLVGHVNIVLKPCLASFEDEMVSLEIDASDRTVGRVFIRPIMQVPDTLLTLIRNALQTMQERKYGMSP